MTSLQLVANGREQLKRPLMFSAVAHACLAVAALVATLVRGVPSIWGEAGGGGAAMVQLVSAASVPLPAPSVPTQNRQATENKGLHYTEPPKPQPKPAAIPSKLEEKAVELPAKNAKVTPPKPPTEAKPKAEEKPPSRREIASTGPAPAPPPQQTRVRKPPVEPEPSNEIPYGEGGPAAGPFGMFQADGGSGGVSVRGDSGDFVSRYSWYVTAIRNRISSNWMKTTVDPSIRVAPRVFVTFQIYRDGRVVNPQLTASSGISSLDRSALRAVYDSSPMPPLPADYRGSSVAVEFWFDFRR
ncbi:MAG: TonB family protein [Acidobacteria bacterium]|nr:TonB family protein [Acidobacteriota bacterium]